MYVPQEYFENKQRRDQRQQGNQHKPSVYVPRGEGQWGGMMGPGEHSHKREILSWDINDSDCCELSGGHLRRRQWIEQRQKNPREIHIEQRSEEQKPKKYVGKVCWLYFHKLLSNIQKRMNIMKTNRNVQEVYGT